VNPLEKCPYCGRLVEPEPSEVQKFHGGAKSVIVACKCPFCGKEL